MYMKRFRKSPIYLALMGALLLGGVAVAQDEEPGAEVQEYQEDNAVEEFSDDTIVDEDEYLPPDDYLQDTVEDIETMISLPPQARLGREADEDPANPHSVFASEEAIEELLGPQPRFVYFPEGIDPMIIPWVREQIVIQEKLADARRALELAQQSRDRNQAQRALDIMNELQSKYPESGQNKDLGTLKQNVEKFIASLESGGPGVVAPPEPQRPDLPRWIVSNTRGVMLDRDNPDESLVLLGDFVLKQGDPVELFPAVSVKEILPQKVVYEYQQSEYVVSVQAL